MAPDATNLKLLEMDRQRRGMSGYLRTICDGLLSPNRQVPLKGGPGQDPVGEVVIIHDDNTQAPYVEIGVVKEVITSKRRLIRSVMVKRRTGTLSTVPFNRYTPELREDSAGRRRNSTYARVELNQKKQPTRGRRRSSRAGRAVPRALGGECVGNILRSQHSTTRVEDDALPSLPPGLPLENVQGKSQLVTEIPHLQDNSQCSRVLYFIVTFSSLPKAQSGLN
ncbi:hypothetical protein OUZ56_024531 [Daphnia magna]|uniref:DUF5641 domain-containing protein n=1 Tax=Daphnia magna TaxID=35525 RepID=A0ABR0B0W7_9CRUS|nr:hypothetical protein OUZ56_024531 [Daphnia magna]